MEKPRKMKALLAILVCCAVSSFVAFAGPEGGPGGDRGPRGPRGGFDREAMQERMMNMMKERMGASDEEWTIIKPRLQEVMEIQRNAMGGGMRFMFGRGRRGEQQEETTSTDPVEVASKELQETLEKAEPTTAEIKAKLAALRGAREKNKQKLVTAQAKLKEVLTIKQEAMLVMMGTLE